MWGAEQRSCVGTGDGRLAAALTAAPRPAAAACWLQTQGCRYFLVRFQAVAAGFAAQAAGRGGRTGRPEQRSLQQYPSPPVCWLVVTRNEDEARKQQRAFQACKNTVEI